jgi:D-serine deaminase-like pyridoxal phosphate-dependent protein
MTSFQLRDPSAVPSPALIFSREAIHGNLDRMLACAGSPNRLRPHMKTHKTRQITQLYQKHGLHKHKCATLKEAEVLASCGAADVLIAYPMVGPNQALACQLAAEFPQTRFAVLGDHLPTLASLQRHVIQQDVRLGLFLDVNVGQNRSGLAREAATALGLQLLELLSTSPEAAGLQLRGLHLYDGHNIAPARSERESLVQATLQQGLQLRSTLQPAYELPLELVFGGTPAFLAYAHLLEADHITLSPGTCILHDAGYSQRYPELGFTPAAAVLTRCVSRPGPRLITFDVGTKAICCDPPVGARCILQGLENAKAVLHNEEHLVLETDTDHSWPVGKETFAIPMHVCPTVAMHDEALILSHNEICDRWQIAARGRQLKTA